MNARPTILLVLACLLQHCSDGGARDHAEPTPPPEDVVGVYTGSFPCSNCAAIAAALWLRADGTFFLRQTYLEEGQAAADGKERTYALGQWRWDERSAEIVLASLGPERRLTVRDHETLRLEVASPVEHRLERDPSSPPFADRITLDGESAVSKQGASFTECLTGTQWPVLDGGAAKELRRQHRVMNPRGKIALTTVEAHLETVDGAEGLVVDRFVAIKPGTGCTR
jgi:NlpE N-terminal domain